MHTSSKGLFSRLAMPFRDGITAFIRHTRSHLPNQGSGRTSALSLVDQVAVSATGFLSGVIVARYCTLTELGVYHLAISVMLILRGVQADLITTPFAVYCCKRDTKGQASYFGSMLVHQFASIALSLIAIGVLYLALYNDLAPRGLLAAMPAFIFAVPMVLLREFFRLISFAQLKIRNALVTDAMVMTIQLVGLFWVARTMTLGADHALWVIGMACGIASMAWWLIIRPRFRIDFPKVVQDWRVNWRFGRWALASFLVCNCTPYIMIWLVAWLRSEAETGKFGSCVLLIGLSNLFLIAIQNVLTPLTASRHNSEGITGLLRVCRKAIALFILVLGSITVLMFFIGDWLGGMVYGNDFADVGVLCGMLALAKLLESISVVAVKVHWAVDRPQMNMPADIATVCMTVAVALYALPQFGINGAAMAVLAGNAAGMAIRWWTVIRYTVPQPAEG